MYRVATNTAVTTCPLTTITGHIGSPAWSSVQKLEKVNQARLTEPAMAPSMAPMMPPICIAAVGNRS